MQRASAQQKNAQMAGAPMMAAAPSAAPQGGQCLFQMANVARRYCNPAPFSLACGCGGSLGSHASGAGSGSAAGGYQPLISAYGQSVAYQGY